MHAEEITGLPAAVEVAAAYLIAGEATANAVRHAGAGEVHVRLHVADGYLRLEVVDDGAGFPANVSRGMGSSSMRERAEELGGLLQVESGAAGTRVTALLPQEST